MDDPLSALVYAVQVMNVLKTLILMTLKDREQVAVLASSSSCHDPSDNGGESSSDKLTLKGCENLPVELVEGPNRSSGREGKTRKTSKQPRKQMKNKPRGITLVSSINSRMERVEAWR